MSVPSPARTAIVYDFDGTLAKGNIQEHSLLPDYLKTSKEEFWGRVARCKQDNDADQILVYMRLLLERAGELGIPLSQDILRQHGAAVQLFEGVESWFERINQHALEHGLSLEHYVVSSGNEEMIQGTQIAHHFTQVFACKYIYDEAGNAVWPGAVVNYTSKTQYLFRINKGVKSYWDDEPVNRWIPLGERPVPFSRMIYLGDGDTDIPSMKMVRHQGGHSVAVFDPEHWQKGMAQPKAYKLIAENRAHFVVPADYREDSQLDVTVKGLLGRIGCDNGA